MSLHETLLTALRSSPHTTIVFGNGGRYRDALEHALHTVWLPRGGDDDSSSGSWFQFEGRDVYLLVESEFGHVIHPSTLVLTSHLDLQFDPRHTRVVACHMPTRQTTAPNTREEGDAYQVAVTAGPHQAYLDLLTRSETTPRPWHIVMTPELRRQWRQPLARSKAACQAFFHDPVLLNHYFGFVGL